MAIHGDRDIQNTGFNQHLGLQAGKTFNSSKNSMENTGLIKETETEEQMRWLMNTGDTNETGEKTKRLLN